MPARSPPSRGPPRLAVPPPSLGDARSARRRGPRRGLQNSTINALLEGVYDGSITYGELPARRLRAGDVQRPGRRDDRGRRGVLPNQVGRSGLSRRRRPAHAVRHRAVLPADAPAAFDRPARLRALPNAGGRTGGGAEPVLRGPGRRPLRVGDDAERAPQEKPYPPLAEVAKTQPVFHLEDVGGTLAGFRFPDFAHGLNVPGFHLHFLTEDRRAGGHVLNLVLERGEVAIDASASFSPGTSNRPDLPPCRPGPCPRRRAGPGRAGEVIGADRRRSFSIERVRPGTADSIARPRSARPFHASSGTGK